MEPSALSFLYRFFLGNEKHFHKFFLLCIQFFLLFSLYYTIMYRYIKFGWVFCCCCCCVLHVGSQWDNFTMKWRKPPWKMYIKYIPNPSTQWRIARKTFSIFNSVFSAVEIKNNPNESMKKNLFFSGYHRAHSTNPYVQ